MTRRHRLVLVAISLISFIIFAAFSYWVKKDIFQGFDFDTTVRLQNHINRRFDLPFSLFSLLGSVEFTLLLLIGIFLMVLLKGKHFFLGLSLYFIILIIELLGKLFVFHPGPPFMFFRYSLGFAFPSSYIITNYSYPSGHMARTTFLAIILLFLTYKFVRSKYHKKLIYIGILVFTILMFLSRVYLGEHWFSDVVGGLILGSSLGGLALAFW